MNPGWLWSIWIGLRGLSALGKEAKKHPEGGYGFVRDLGRAVTEGVKQELTPAIERAKQNWRRLEEVESRTEIKWMDVPEDPKYQRYRALGGLCFVAIIPTVALAVHWNSPNILVGVPAAFVMGFTCLFKSLKYTAGYKQVRFWKGTDRIVENWDKVVDECLDHHTEREKADIELGQKAVLVVLLIAFVASFAYLSANHYRSTHPPRYHSVLEDK